MTGGDSVFSCINQPGPREEAARGAPQSVPAPPQPPRRDDELYAKVAALEAKMQKLEEAGSAAAAAVEGLKAEARAAQRRAAELERDAAELKRISGAGSLAVAQVKEELSALRGWAASLEEIARRLDPSALSSVALSVDLLEGRLKNLESGLSNELKERFSVLDAAFGETARKAGMSQEMAAGSARRVEKLEERVSRLSYLESRLAGSEGKLERIYELDALSQSLKLSVEGMEKNFSAAMRESSLVSAGHKKICSDFESLAAQVRQLTALFNQFRTELAFLMPKKQESIGG